MCLLRVSGPSEVLFLLLCSTFCRRLPTLGALSVSTPRDTFPNPEFHKVSTMDIWGQISLRCTLSCTFLYMIGCLGAAFSALYPLGSSITPSQLVPTKCLQTLPNISWGQNCLQVKTNALTPLSSPPLKQI